MHGFSTCMFPMKESQLRLSEKSTTRKTGETEEDIVSKSPKSQRWNAFSLPEWRESTSCRSKNAFSVINENHGGNSDKRGIAVLILPSLPNRKQGVKAQWITWFNFFVSRSRQSINSFRKKKFLFSKYTSEKKTNCGGYESKWRLKEGRRTSLNGTGNWANSRNNSSRLWPLRVRSDRRECALRSETSLIYTEKQSFFENKTDFTFNSLIPVLVKIFV